MSAAFVQIAAVFAELERGLISARVKSSLKAKAAQGIHIGRKKLTKDDIPPAFYKHYPMLQDGRMNISEMARVIKRSRPTVYRYLKLIEEV